MENAAGTKGVVTHGDRFKDEDFFLRLESEIPNVEAHFDVRILVLDFLESLD